MTVITYSKADIGTISPVWIAARDAEKKNVRIYHGDRPCLPAAAMLAVCRRISTKQTNP